MILNKAFLVVLALGLLSGCTARGPEEIFHEKLVLRPNQDGTVIASFAFTTLLKGAQPRHPSKLGVEDECT